MCKHCCRRARVCFPNIPQQCCANIAKSGCRKGQFFFQAPANNVMPFHFYKLPQNSAGTYHNSSTFFCIVSKCALNDGANEHSDNSNLQSVCQKLVQAAIKVLWTSFAVTFEQRKKRLLFKFEFEISWTDWPTATLFLWHNKQEEVFIKASKRQRPLSLGAFSISHVARISKQG